MPSKICVVTGASSGIGKEIARGLALMGSTVVLACRDAARAEAARDEISTATRNPNVWPMSLDLARIASIDAFVDELRRRFGRLDLLVNNAAAIWRKRKLTESGVESTFAVNHLGPFALTLGLLELLEASAPSRIVMVSSKLHVGGRLELDDLLYEKRRYSGFAAYNASKLANVIFARTLARRLGRGDVRVNAVHPGEAATAIGRDYGRIMMLLMRLLYRSPKLAAATPLYVATSPDAEADVSGRFFRDSRQAPHSPLADDVALQDRLWSVSEELIRAARAAAPVAGNGDRRVA
jgi:NAD(P)-dependent dehydrogenase (short-subunit alcohol dehydrogenase family)